MERCRHCGNDIVFNGFEWFHTYEGLSLSYCINVGKDNRGWCEGDTEAEPYTKQEIIKKILDKV